ncbi:MAG: hypothetical protein ACE5JM_07210, partial [Armatimonadota bacterium]
MTSIFPGPVPQFEFPAVYGIRIQVFPTEPDAQVVIERAADSAGSPNLATVEVIARLNLRVNVTHEDVLPNDGLRRHYRARHEHPDFTASANTGWVNAKPAILFAGSDRQDVSPFFFVSGDDPSSATQTWNEVNEHRIGEQGTSAPFAKLVAQGDDLAGGDAWLELRQWVGP